MQKHPCQGLLEQSQAEGRWWRRKTAAVAAEVTQKLGAFLSEIYDTSGNDSEIRTMIMTGKMYRYSKKNDEKNSSVPKMTTNRVTTTYHNNQRISPNNT